MKRVFRAIGLSTCILGGLLLLVIARTSFSLSFTKSIQGLAERADYLLVLYLIMFLACWIIYEVRFRGGVDE